VDALRQMGKRLYFVTNNSTKSRQGVHKKFSSLGFDVRDEGGYVWEFTTY
jgi:ribonucleotide monophosphatase NagD (HAD superfamily)